ncbi:efflux RND transporter periplasmic adaptor subunit [Nitrosospira multiformis]|uniref:efflux RND transporter periplasmic adaptor subunit n=1 Tax=Nitrosospira multiformis TaxID=1231 RepID=UPI000898EADB|nr:efflux RND transporter periplasmic adaptor subunit [Nitrosospira multiformis]SEA04028.1 membrane fusion protein, multidrug efflux system [Nitrosospira multiformis]
MSSFFFPLRVPRHFVLISIIVIFSFSEGCSEPPEEKPPPVAEVTAVSIEPRDTPIELEFVAETRSSRHVEIRARVSGFLDKRLYTEGEVVQAGQKMYQMDRKPFEAALQSAEGQFAQQQARLQVAEATLRRVRPLAEKNALSKKNLDDATGAVQQASAAVLAAEGEVRTAKLNLSYTTIRSPLHGLASFSLKHEGSYLSPGEGGLLTYVDQIDPIWVIFSVSENQMLKYRSEIERSLLKFPPLNRFEVQITLANGALFPNVGHIDFSEPSFSEETGTFLVRTQFINPGGVLRPGQFVRVHLKGAVRPNSILVPQRAVLQGAKSHYVWVINKEGKVERRDVEAGDWQGEGWFINHGLVVGERVVVDGAVRLSPGSTVKVVDTLTPPSDQTGTKPAAGQGTTPAASIAQPPEEASVKPGDLPSKPDSKAIGQESRASSFIKQQSSTPEEKPPE